jgi:hypothetical protein
MGLKEHAEAEMARVAREAKVYVAAREYMRRQVEVMRLHGGGGPDEGSLPFEAAVAQVAEHTLKVMRVSAE